VFLRISAVSMSLHGFGLIRICGMEGSSRCRGLGGCGRDGAYLDHFVWGRSRLGSDPAYGDRFGSATPEISEQDWIFTWFFIVVIPCLFGHVGVDFAEWVKRPRIPHWFIRRVSTLWWQLTMAPLKINFCSCVASHVWIERAYPVWIELTTW